MMATADRQAMTLGQDQLGAQPAAITSRKTTMGRAPTPGMLDPLIRALDRAVIRSAQLGSGCSTPAARD